MLKSDDQMEYPKRLRQMNGNVDPINRNITNNVGVFSAYKSSRYRSTLSPYDIRKASELVGILPRSMVSLALASRRSFRIRYRHAHIGMNVSS